MAAFEPTASQREAITARGGTLLVSAGAGSGKTKVLTERLMGYLLDRESPVGLDRFVVITFTQAAAAELRGRITDELARAAGNAEKDPSFPPKLLAHIRRQQALCAGAQIGTIHHFCSSLLRENGHRLSIPSDFQIISEERADLMKAEALEKVLNVRYRSLSDYPGFEDLVNSAGAGRDDSRLAALTLQLYTKMQCHPHPEKWAKDRVKDLLVPVGDVGETEWGKELLSSARSTAHYWVGELERVMAAIAADEVVKAAYLDAIALGADGVRALERALSRGWDAARECPPVVFGKLGKVKKDYAPALTGAVKNRRDACKKAMEKIAVMLCADSDTLAKELRLTAPAMDALVSLTLDLVRQYGEDKLASNRLDYSDLEHFTAQLLLEADETPTPLARSLSDRYTEIMIDEYQDVSRVQDSIFFALSRGGKNLFLVGDVKQAIYRFRLADPEIFNEKYRNYLPHSSVAAGEPGRILLRENFRSRREILDAANSVFSRCMTRQLGEIDYDASAALIFGATKYEGTVPVPSVRLFPLPEPEEGKNVPDKTAFEAQCVAESISALLASGIPIGTGDGERPAQYGDIAILLRNANSVGGIYRRVLTERGIPVVSGQGGGLFETREVSFVLSMLRVLDNARNDVSLLAVLTSPVFGLTPDDLASVRASSEKPCLYEALKEHAAEDPKTQRFFTVFEKLRNAAPDLTAERMLRMLYDETDLFTLCSAMPDGQNRCANLMQLIPLAEAFEAEGVHGLHTFVKHLEKQKEKNAAIPAASAEASAVQILSIHRSKGLEFPIVFLCDTARHFNLRDSSDTVLIHPELGFGPKLTDRERHVQTPTLARKAIALRMRHETLSEEMRLQYVALTRAKERLFITATMTSPGDLVEKQRALLSGPGQVEPEVLSSASAPIEWYVAAALADGEQHLRLDLSLPEASEQQTVKEPAVPEAEKKHLDEILSRLEKNLSFTYPYPDALSLPSKITATELKHFDSPADPESAPLLTAPGRERHTFRMPELSAREHRPLTGTERGIATHLALQYMDLSGADTPEGVASEIRRLLERRFLSEHQAEAVRQDAIVRLFRSDVGRRIRSADAVHREFRFSLLCRANELLPTASDEEILLQGVVDCCLEENGSLVIIDYKTDSVWSPEQIAARAELYASQVRAYAMALTRIFRMPVRETVLYFLSCGKSVSVPNARA